MHEKRKLADMWIMIGAIGISVMTVAFSLAPVFV